MDTHSLSLRLRRKDIAYFKFIIESYEGMAVVRTQDPSEAVVELMVAPGWEEDVEEVLAGLQKEIPMEFLSNHASQGTIDEERRTMDEKGKQKEKENRPAS
jgi:hypothetical protein